MSTRVGRFTPNFDLIGAGGELTAAEEALVQALNALPITGPTEAIAKTGATTLANQVVSVTAVTIWGTITGTLSNQTDLQAALDAKGDVSSPLNQFAATTSAQLASKITDETGTGSLVFANSPVLVTPTLGAAVGTSLQLSGLTASEILGTDASKNLVSLAVATYPSLTELTYVKGVTSAIQTQINTKAPSASPTFTVSITGSYLTASEILITDGSKNIVSAAVATYPSLTELTYVKGVTSAIQTQINTKANSAGALTQFVGNGNWKVWYSDGSGDTTELALGADGTFLQSNGESAAPTWETASGSGDVSKVGTPANNQVGVWTGDGTIEGDAALTFDTDTNTLATGDLSLSNDLLIASAGIINFDAGDVTITHSANTLTIAGGSLVATLGAITLAGVVSGGGQQLNNIIIGTVTPLAGAFTTIAGTAITGTSFVIGANTLDTNEWAFLDGQNQAVATTSSPTFVNLTITSFAANWTNAGRTVADAGILTTVDINGGTIDGVTIGGSSAGAITGTTITVNTNLVPDANDGAGLGVSGTAFSDLFLASGSVINWVAGDVTLTHAAGKLTFGGDGAVEIDFNNHEMTNVDINSGAIDGTTIGAASASSIIGTTIDATTDFTIGGTVITDATITDDGTLTINATTAVSFSDKNITNVGDIALDSLTADATTIALNSTLILAENTSIQLDPAGSADGKYSGITVTGTGGATIAFGDLVTLDKDDSRWELVDISVAAAATGDARGVIGIAATSSTDGGAITVLLKGIIRADANFPALTIGAPVYASTTGDVVVAQPTTTDHVIRIIGFALTADEIFFCPDNSYITHT